MKILIDTFFDEQLAQVVNKISQAIKIDECVWVYFQKPHVLKAKRLMHVPRADAYPDADYQVEWNELLPLDEKLLIQMAPCEVQVLKMMDRMERSKEHFYSYEERKRIYLRHLRYWNHILESKKIQLFLSSSPPHQVYDYVIYCLCRMKNIPTIFLETLSQFKAALTVQPQIAWVPEINKTELARLEKEKSGDTLFVKEACALQNLKKRSPIFLFNTKSNFERDAKIYRTFKFCRDNVLNVVRGIKNQPLFFLHLSSTMNAIFNKIKCYLNLLKIEIIEDRLLHHYECLTAVPDWHKKYIYLPLNFQPELSTSPMAGTFVDQLLMVQLLSYCLPPDVYLYVKEHPQQKIVGRHGKYYDDLCEVRGVKLISRKCDTFQLTENSLAVAICSGTPGWEALFRGKPVLMFGRDFYLDFPGVFRIKTLTECQAAVNSVLKEKVKPTLAQVKAGLKLLEPQTVKGCADNDYRNFSGVTEEETVNNLTDTLLKKIKQLNLT